MGTLSSMKKANAINVSEIEAIFKNGAPIRGKSSEYRPSFWRRLILLFSPKFQVRIGGKAVKSTFWRRAKALFTKGFVLRKEGAILGRGLFEQDLIKIYGYTRKDLDMLVKHEILAKTTTAYKSAWRTTYLFRMPVKLEGE